MSSICNKALAAVSLILLGVGSALADGTGGCVASPENPTMVLGLIAGATAGLPWARARIAALRGKRNAEQQGQ